MFIEQYQHDKVDRYSFSNISKIALRHFASKLVDQFNGNCTYCTKFILKNCN